MLLLQYSIQTVLPIYYNYNLIKYLFSYDAIISI
jgi:hypothetical protein